MAIGLILFFVGAVLLVFCLAKLAQAFIGKKPSQGEQSAAEPRDRMTRRKAETLDLIRPGHRPSYSSYLESDTPSVAGDWWEQASSNVSQPVAEETHVCTACFQSPCVCGAYDAEMGGWDW